MPARTHADPLNDWIDVRNTGSVPPPAPPNDPDLTDLFATANQLDHLARSSEQHATTDRLPIRSWVNVMQIAPSITATGTMPPDPASRRPQVVGSHHIARRLHRPLSTVMAAALVLALLTGVWNASGRPGLPNREPEPLSYGSFAVQGEDELFEIAPIPTAEECVVEPLTVDEVMARITTYQYPLDRQDGENKQLRPWKLPHGSTKVSLGLLSMPSRARSRQPSNRSGSGLPAA